MARLLSVNVGLPQDIAWQGRTVHTAVWKRAVTGRRMARRLNLDGDGQGDRVGHGGEHRAVFVYQIESYRYWERELGRDDFSFGQFGENFTVEGMADDAVCIGERYRIGSALFEVTQPRVTCYRVGIRMDEPRMAALLTGSGRPGFYFRVLEEGQVEAGDAIVKVASGAEQMSVARINALLYLPGHRRDDLERALRIPALSAGWKGSLRAMLEQKSGLAPADVSRSPPAWAGFRPLRVAAKARESADVLSLALEPADALQLATPLPGQFIVLRLQPDAKRRRSCAAIRSRVRPMRRGTVSASSSRLRVRPAFISIGRRAWATPCRRARRAGASPSSRERDRSYWQAPASALRPCWQSCTRWPPSVRRGQSGGCMARARAPIIPSPPNRAPYCGACPMPAAGSGTAGLQPRTGKARISTPAAMWRSPLSKV